VKSNVKTLLSGDVRSTFGIFHENHATRRGERASLETFQDSISGSVIATPVVGVDDEAAARSLLRMNVRFRQVNLASPLDL
jgi:hypothetical protein